MQTANTDFLIEASKRGRTPMAKVVREATEVGVVVPSILRGNLEAAGYSIIEDSAALAEYGFTSLKSLSRTVVLDSEGAIVAMGASSDHADALLHAMLGYFRENPPGGMEPTEGIATAPTQAA